MKIEIVERLALKHSSGMYLSTSPDNQPNTKNLRQARRFLDTEQINVFLNTSPYAPDKPSEYEIVTVEIQYKEVPME